MSLFRSPISTALLLAVLLLDGGSDIVSFILDDKTRQWGIHAANADHTSLRLLKEVVPGADSFSDKEGEVPVYKAFREDPSSGAKTLIGYAFVSADFPPEPNGFNGEIDSLVGLDLEGNIVGIKVIYYKESLRATWGDFLSDPWYLGQFIGKRAADGFSVGKDIDGISRATISVKAMARGVRQSLRAVTEAYIR